MSTDHEKNKIIKHFLSSFKNKELYLINSIVYLFKNFQDGGDLYNKTRIELQKVVDLKNLDIILNNLLNILNTFQLNNIKNDKNSIYHNFISISELNKIIKNKRLTHLIKITNESKYPNYFDNSYYSIKLFNLPELELNDILNFQEIINLNNEKNEVLTNINNKYSKLINHKSNLNKYIKDKDFLNWAIAYLSKKPNFKYTYSAINPDDHEDIINKYFDSIFIYNELKYEKEIDIIKKAWQQKQFRNQGKTKKEYHLPLTKKAKKELMLLANMNNLRENAILEKLIHQAYLNEMCDENGKPIY